jgi:hypothetical protein
MLPATVRITPHGRHRKHTASAKQHAHIAVHS